VVNYSADGYSGHLCRWFVRELYKPVVGIEPEENVSASWVGIYLSDMSDYEVPPDDDPRYLQSVDYLGEADGYRAALGYLPAQRLICDTPSGEKVSHRLLGHVALHLAELLHSYVDLGGSYFPPMEPRNEHLDQDTLRRMAQGHGEDGLQPWSHTGPGQIIEAFYSSTRHAVYHTEDGSTVGRLSRWYWNIVDPVFLRHYVRTGNLDHGR
jgi:hypothetical protein